MQPKHLTFFIDVILPKVITPSISSTSSSQSHVAMSSSQSHIAVSSFPKSRSSVKFTKSCSSVKFPKSHSNVKFQKSRSNVKFQKSRGKSTRRYCFCRRGEEVEMMACDYPDCAYKWFHFSCVSLKTAPKGK